MIHQICYFFTTFAVFGMGIAQAGSFGLEHEKLVNQSLELIHTMKSESSELDKIFQRWNEIQNTCKTNVPPLPSPCVITECDVFPQNCRKDRALFFRGESSNFKLPATSALWRTLKAGSHYADHLDIFGIIQKLDDSRKDVQEWNRVHEYGDYTANYRQHLFILHSKGEFEPLEIDPMISFTVSPKTAYTFANRLTNNLGRLIVISVPKSEVGTLCPSDYSKPGEIIDSRDEACGRGLTQFSEENEVDAFLYVNPTYIWKVFTSASPSKKAQSYSF